MLSARYTISPKLRFGQNTRNLEPICIYGLPPERGTWNLVWNLSALLSPYVRRIISPSLSAGRKLRNLEPAPCGTR